MYVGLKQPRGDGERYVTPARAAAKETRFCAICPSANCHVVSLAAVFSVVTQRSGSSVA